MAREAQAPLHPWSRVRKRFHEFAAASVLGEQVPLPLGVGYGVTADDCRITRGEGFVPLLFWGCNRNGEDHCTWWVMRAFWFDLAF